MEDSQEPEQTAEGKRHEQDDGEKDAASRLVECETEIGHPAKAQDDQRGENTAKVVLNLTATETYMRYYRAYRFSRLREAYRFVHPDVKKHDDFAEFKKDMRSGDEVLGLRLFDEKFMKKWRCPWAKRTYKEIVAIDRVFRFQTVYGAYTDNRTQHWQQIDGRWYIIFKWDD